MRNLLTACCLALGLSCAWAADPYPSKPITLVVPQAPGGANDIVGRALAQRLAVVANGLDDLAAKLTSLKWIQTTYGGGGSYLTPSVVARKIPVTCSRGVQAQPLSEFTEACVLALAKRFPLLGQIGRAHV